MGITEILRRIWLFSANKIKSSESFSKQSTQLIVELNSFRHIIVTQAPPDQLTIPLNKLPCTEGAPAPLESCIARPHRATCRLIQRADWPASGLTVLISCEIKVEGSSLAFPDEYGNTCYVVSSPGLQTCLFDNSVLPPGALQYEIDGIFCPLSLLEKAKITKSIKKVC